MQVHEGHGQFGVHEVEAGDVGRRSIAHGIGGNPLSGFFVGLPDVDGRDTAGKLVDVVRGEFAIRRRSVSETSSQINPRCFSRNACSDTLRRLSAIAVASGPAGVLNWSLVSMAQRSTAVATSASVVKFEPYKPPIMASKCGDMVG